MAQTSRIVLVLAITLQFLSLAWADDCAAYSTDGKTCTMTETGDGGYDCTCTKAITVTNDISLLPAQFNIKGLGSGKCADVDGVSMDDNARIHIWDCLGKGQRNQVWSAQPAPGGGYNLVVAHSGKCLTIKGTNADATPIVQFDCVGAPNQIWEFKNSNGKMTEITNPASGGKCMDVEGWGKGNGAKIHLYTCHGQENQLWNVVPV